MKILSIETSCDETAVSIIEATGDIHHPKFTILGNALYSQISVHAEYGGVFPALAKREHTQNLVPMLKLATELAFEKILNTSNSDSSTTSIPEITKEKRLQILEILSRENDLGDQLLNFLDTHEVFDVDAIAVTQGPGLEPALWVGISFAKALAIALSKPLIPINHMEGHIVSVLMESNEQSDSIEGDNKNTNGDNKDCDNKEIGNTDSDCSGAIQFPALALLISGGHTELVLSKNWHQYEVIGQTVDDAVGEAFDKVARIMNLPYPGGPKISKLAAESRTENVREKVKGDTGTYPWILPRPMLKSPDFNFSFSGLKTAVLYAVKDRLKDRIAAHTEHKRTHQSETIAPHLIDIEIKTLAEEFENAVTDVLVYKTSRAIEETNAQTLIIGGGVIANTYIREAFKKVAHETGVSLFTPSVSLSTDNSVMIGVAGYLRWIAKDSGVTKNNSIILPDDLLGADGILDMEKLAGLRANGNLSLQLTIAVD